MVKKKYVLVTAARNEENQIGETIESILSQRVKPSKWVIVNDGSTDRTQEVAEKYMRGNEFIQTIRFEDVCIRNFASQVHAINFGYNLMKKLDFDYFGNLDADITLESDYYDKILEKFEKNLRLGLAGGFVKENVNGLFKTRLFNSLDSVPHAIQLFRRECYESFQGYIPLKYGGPDWYAEIMSRKNGWKVQAFRDIPVYHRRRTCAAEGMMKGGFRQGLMDFSVGSHPLFEFLKCVSRVRERPLFLYAIMRFTGFSWANMKREKRIVSKDFINFLRQEQINRIRAFVNP